LRTNATLVSRSQTAGVGGLLAVRLFKVVKLTFAQITQARPGADRLLPGEFILATSQLTSPNKEFTLDLQEKPEFTISRKAKSGILEVVWRERHHTSGPATAKLNKATLKLCLGWNGNLLVYDDQRILYWHSKTIKDDTDNLALVLQNDGHLVLQGGSWSSGVLVSTPRDIPTVKSKDFAVSGIFW
jgi:hypothetical protein